MHLCRAHEAALKRRTKHKNGYKEQRMVRDHRKIRSRSYKRGSMRDCNLAAGQNSQAVNCCLPCSRESFFLCSTKLLATFPSSARSGSPTPHLSSDPLQILSRAVMRAEATVKQKEVWCARWGERVGNCNGKMKSETTRKGSRTCR